jgi:hypothetical protein
MVSTEGCRVRSSAKVRLAAALTSAAFMVPMGDFARPRAEISVLIYGPTLYGFPWDERGVAENLGYTVTVADETMWSSFSQADFESFNAIVFGDPSCGERRSILDAAVANRDVWTPAVTGNVMIIGMDPITHQAQGDALELVRNGIHFVTNAPGTGMLFNLSCYYAYAHNDQPVEALGGFGTITVEGAESDDADINRPGHPAMLGIAESGLSGWGHSIHQTITRHPQRWGVLVTDGSTGQAAVVASRSLGR